MSFFLIYKDESHKAVYSLVCGESFFFMRILKAVRSQMMTHCDIKLLGHISECCLVKNSQAMNLINLMQHFPEEESCEIYLRSFREKTGVLCKSC